MAARRPWLPNSGASAPCTQSDYARDRVARQRHLRRGDLTAVRFPRHRRTAAVNCRLAESALGTYLPHHLCRSPARCRPHRQRRSEEMYLHRSRRWHRRQAERWVGSGLLIAQKQFRRIKGYKHIPALLTELHALLPLSPILLNGERHRKVSYSRAAASTKKRTFPILFLNIRKLCKALDQTPGLGYRSEALSAPQSQ